MEYNIDEYIKQTENMENCSVGGSAAYNFGDVVLVKYLGDRLNSEEVAEEINKLNTEGVHIPKHLAIKRTEVDGGMITWVLQETSRGINKAKYAEGDNQTKLSAQRMLLDAPDSHFENLVKDVLAIGNNEILGTEYKPKNIFYDSDKDKGGFFLIDFLYRPKRDDCFESNSSATVYSSCNTIVNNSLSCSGGIEEESSKNNYYTLQKRIFNACERVLPDQRRNILRFIYHHEGRETLKYFAKNGVIIGDLTLNDKEQENFATETNRLLDYCLEKIETGKLEYRDVKWNTICNDSYSLQAPWLFHPLNTIKREDYEYEYAYWGASNSKFEDILLESFDRKLDAAVNNNPNANPNLIKAWDAAQKGKRSENTSNKENDAIMAGILKAKLVR